MSATTVIARWFTQTVTVERLTGPGAFGPVFATGASASAFIVAGSVSVHLPTGETTTSIARVYLPADTATVPLGSRVTLPATYGSKVTTVIGAELRISSRNTPDHLKLVLQ